MPVWNIAPVEDRPDVTLTNWAVFEVPLNGPDQPWTRHVAGWACEREHGQVSSQVMVLDSLTSTCVTRSGRAYRLVGVPGLCADADYVLRRWLEINGLSELRDVTAEVLVAIDAAQARSRKVH
jgi:hypothetical protein